MVEQLIHLRRTQQHLRPQRLTSARAEQPLRFLGVGHTCAILDNGDLKCWGWDNYGQLGDGGTQHTTYTYTTAPSSTAIDLGTGRRPWPFLLELTTPAPSLTTAMRSAGGDRMWGSWAKVPPPP